MASDDWKEFTRDLIMASRRISEEKLNMDEDAVRKGRKYTVLRILVEQYKSLAVNQILVPYRAYVESHAQKRMVQNILYMLMDEAKVERV